MPRVLPPPRSPFLVPLCWLAGACSAGAPQAGEEQAPPLALYRIEHGDTLGELARRFSTPAAELAALNRLDNPHRIRAGAGLLVPRRSLAGVELPEDYGRDSLVAREDGGPGCDLLDTRWVDLVDPLRGIGSYFSGRRLRFSDGGWTREGPTVVRRRTDGFLRDHLETEGSWHLTPARALARNARAWAEDEQGGLLGLADAERDPGPGAGPDADPSPSSYRSARCLSLLGFDLALWRLGDEKAHVL